MNSYMYLLKGKKLVRFCESSTDVLRPLEYIKAYYTTFLKISDFQINWNLLLNVPQRAFFHAFSPHYNGFLRTNLNIGVKMSFLPPWMRASAAVSNTLWTSVEPRGTMRSISMADSMKWVSFRPTEDTLKASREKACLPTRNVYLKEKKIENSQERCSKAL